MPRTSDHALHRYNIARQCSPVAENGWTARRRLAASIAAAPSPFGETVVVLIFFPVLLSYAVAFMAQTVPRRRIADVLAAAATRKA
jgi:hypothetical protein